MINIDRNLYMTCRQYHIFANNWDSHNAALNLSLFARTIMKEHGLPIQKILTKYSDGCFYEIAIYPVWVLMEASRRAHEKCIDVLEVLLFEE